MFKQFEFLKDTVGMNCMANSCSIIIIITTIARTRLLKDTDLCWISVGKGTQSSQVLLGFLVPLSYLSIMFVLIYSYLTRIYEGHWQCGFCMRLGCVLLSSALELKLVQVPWLHCTDFFKNQLIKIYFNLFSTYSWKLKLLICTL